MNILKSGFAIAAVLVAATLVSPASASPVLQGTSTLLTGIDDLTIEGNSYNVAFVDGTCASVFGACDTAHFAFTTSVGAEDAADAVLAAIAGTYFDSHGGTVGCPLGSISCAIYTPFSVGGYLIAYNSYAGPDFTLQSTFSTTDDTAGDIYSVWAVFSANGTVSAVPEPITLSLFGAGLAGAFAMRRKKKA